MAASIDPEGLCSKRVGMWTRNVSNIMILIWRHPSDSYAHNNPELLLKPRKTENQIEQKIAKTGKMGW